MKNLMTHHGVLTSYNSLFTLFDSGSQSDLKMPGAFGKATSSRWARNWTWHSLSSPSCRENGLDSRLDVRSRQQRLAFLAVAAVYSFGWLSLRFQLPAFGDEWPVGTVTPALPRPATAPGDKMEKRSLEAGHGICKNLLTHVAVLRGP